VCDRCCGSRQLDPDGLINNDNKNFPIVLQEERRYWYVYMFQCVIKAAVSCSSIELCLLVFNSSSFCLNSVWRDANSGYSH